MTLIAVVYHILAVAQNQKQILNAARDSIDDEVRSERHCFSL